MAAILALPHTPCSVVRLHDLYQGVLAWPHACVVSPVVLASPKLLIPSPDDLNCYDSYRSTGNMINGQ